MPGLIFRKMDLHVHTPASKCYVQQEDTPQKIVQSALDRKLAAIAIADHNTAAWIDAMKEAAEGTELVIFPGVEISVSEGFHIVGLFDTSADQKYVENFLGGIGITSDQYGKQEALCTKSPYEVIKKIHELQGLAVLAHIDRPKGAFQEKTKTQDGGKIKVPVPCSKLLNDAEYDAVECVDGYLPDGFDEAHQIERIPAFYQASDNPDPDQPVKHSAQGIGTVYSWFKLDQLDLEGLRQCFSDPEVRIRLMDEEESTGYPKIVSMRIGDSGFLRYQNFQFHDGLNSIIGGKGVGKSLGVEFLRFALDQTSSDPNLTQDLLGKLEKRLEPNNTVEVVYQLPDGTQYKIEQTYLKAVKGSNGDYPLSEHKCTNLATGIPYLGDIPQMFPILAYSQTEVIKIAENREAQLELIDRFIDTRTIEREIQETRDLLTENDLELAEAISARDRLDACERQIATHAEQIATINKSLADSRFDAMKWAEAKDNAFNRLFGYAGDLVALVEGWKGRLLRFGLPRLPRSFKNDPDLDQQEAVLQQAYFAVDRMLDDVLAKLQTAKDGVPEAYGVWKPEFDTIEKEYQALLEQIGGDRKQKETERRALEEEKSRLEREADNYRKLANDLSTILETRKELLERLERAYRSYYDVRKEKFDDLTKLSDGKLQLVLEHAADRSTYISNLSALLRGGHTALSVADRRKLANAVAPGRLVDLVLNSDKHRLAEESGLTELWAGRAIDKLWSSDDFAEVLALQHNCYPADIPAIKFRKAKKQYGELSELSVGQKCTALLIIALCDGTMPIVIDQPEDALDIVSVWEDIAKKLRRGKNSRQFILTTHNSSVAVSADSDQFIVLSGSANSGKVIAAGAIDRPEVKEAVIRHMEGGKEPYLLRSRKYNIDK